MYQKVFAVVAVLAIAIVLAVAIPRVSIDIRVGPATGIASASPALATDVEITNLGGLRTGALKEEYYNAFRVRDGDTVCHIVVAANPNVPPPKLECK